LQTNLETAILLERKVASSNRELYYTFQCANSRTSAVCIYIYIYIYKFIYIKIYLELFYNINKILYRIILF